MAFCLEVPVASLAWIHREENDNRWFFKNVTKFHLRTVQTHKTQLNHLKESTRGLRWTDSIGTLLHPQQVGKAAMQIQWRFDWCKSKIWSVWASTFIRLVYAIICKWHLLFQETDSRQFCRYWSDWFIWQATEASSHVFSRSIAKKEQVCAVRTTCCHTAFHIRITFITKLFM